MSRYLIVGGVAGGMSAAARLRRLDEKAEIIVFEKGPYVSYANCGLPYYISGVIEDKNALTLQTPESFNKRFAVDVRVNSEVISIDRAAKKLKVRAGAKEYEESYDKLVLSPGAEPVKPPIPGIDGNRIFTLRTIPDTFKIKEFMEKEKPASAVVIGAGYIGLEMAENLHMAGVKVTVIEAMPQVLNVFDADMASLAASHLKKKGVELMLGTSVKSFKEEKGKVIMELPDGAAVSADFAVLSIGVRADIRLAKEAGLECGKGISINEYLQTSDPDIYAVGDAVEVLNPVLNTEMVMPLAGPANKQGRMGADNIVEGNKRKYAGTFGAAVLKVFDLTAAAVGPAAKALDAANIPYETVLVHPGSHAGYYPGAAPISLKLLFSPSDGRILGAQAIGAEMAEKKIDVISAFMQKHGTVYDLEEFEQCYAPPYSSAKDAVNMAGFVAVNVLSGKIKPILWEKVLKDRSDYFILDVRTKSEFSRGAAPGAVNIPVDDLRQGMAGLPKDKKIAVYCGVGIRSYIAVRMLVQNGFTETYNISGGYFSFMQFSAI